MLHIESVSLFQKRTSTGHSLIIFTYGDVQGFIFVLLISQKQQ